MSETQFVYFFGNGKAQGDATMKDELGGKGANLAEMTNLGIPVPPGFTISTEVCKLFYDNNRQYPEGWLELFDKPRAAVNEWLKNTDEFEMVFDYDVAVRDETKAGYMKEGFHIGDGLHPNEKGGAAIADAIDLKLLTDREGRRES